MPCRDRMTPASRGEPPASVTLSDIPAPRPHHKRLRANGSSFLSRLGRLAGTCREQVHAFGLTRPGLRVVLPVGQRHLQLDGVVIDTRVAFLQSSRRCVDNRSDRSTSVRHGRWIRPPACCRPSGRRHSVPLPTPMPVLEEAMMWHPRSEKDGGHAWLRGVLRETAAALSAMGRASHGAVPHRPRRHQASR